MATQSDILNANLDWLQKGKEEVFAEYKIADHKTIHDRIEKARRSTFDLSKFTVVGSPTITEDGIASGFSSTNLITIQNINFNQASSWKIVIKCHNMATPAITEYLLGHFQNKDFGGLGFGVRNGLLVCWLSSTGTVWDIKNPLIGRALKYDTDYILCIEFTGTKYVLSSYELNTGEYITHAELNSTTKINNPNTPLLIGKQALVYEQYWRGSIDLKAFSIEVDGKEVFNGNKTGVDQISKNYEVTGSPTISKEGILSNLTNTNKIDFEAKISNRYRLEGEVEKDNLTTSSYILNDALVLYINGSGSTQAIVNIDGTVVSIGTRGYDINGSHKLRFFIENNNNTWTYGLAQGSGEFGIVSKALSSGTFLNTISLTNIGLSYNLSSLRIFNDERIDYTVGLFIPYTLASNGAKIVDTTYRERVQDMYEQFGYTHYYTIGDEPEKYNVQVVGNPTLVGGVASGFNSVNYIKIPLTLDKPFKMTFYETLVNASSLILGVGSDEKFVIDTASGDRYRFYVNNSVSSSFVTPITNEQLKFEVIWDGSVYNLNIYRSNGALYTNITLNDTNSIGSINLLTYSLNFDKFLNGSIDLSQFSIEVDGKEVFRGYEPAIVDAYTLQTVPNEKIVDSYYADNSFMELTADLSLTQGGGAVSGQTVNLKRPYKDNKYIATIGTTSKDTNSFVASASGQWITKGKGVLG